MGYGFTEMNGLVDPQDFFVHGMKILMKQQEISFSSSSSLTPGARGIFLLFSESCLFGRLDTLTVFGRLIIFGHLEALLYPKARPILDGFDMEPNGNFFTS